MTTQNPDTASPSSSEVGLYGHLHNETEAYADLLCSHLLSMVWRLRQIPADKWDWTFAPPAPTPRILAAHAWQWLICDRQHIGEPDATRHAPIPDPPTDPSAMCDALAEETERWRTLIGSLMPEQLAQERHQFNGHEMNVRDFVCHMIQNCIYKNGQLATLYFALGLDGTEPYSAPFPNPLYAMLRQQTELKRARAGEDEQPFLAQMTARGVPESLARQVYEIIARNTIVSGLPIHANDDLEAVFGVGSATGFPLPRALEATARICHRKVIGALEDRDPVRTVGDFTEAMAALTADEGG
jgi:hypothetical protein